MLDRHLDRLDLDVVSFFPSVCRHSLSPLQTRDLRGGYRRHSDADGSAIYRAVSMMVVIAL